MLPITPYLPNVHDSLAQHNNLVLQAEPGAGKSTALPLSLLNAVWLSGKKIIMLEPRRIAAKSIAYYLSAQLGEQVGGRIGYHVKNDRCISDHTTLEIVTEGILTRRLQQDPELSDVGLIILDEFHERSVHSDLALMLGWEVQQSLREDLKLLIMSATIDTQAISRYLDNAPIINCPGRVFPVEVEYAIKTSQRETQPFQPISIQVIEALKSILNHEKTGDILIFLPGQADIQRCLLATNEALDSEHNLRLLPLYGGLTITQQEQALNPDPSGKRRVIFSTNIAETSLTIDGITCVIDTGLEKRVVYDPQSNMSRLETGFISKASADQRKGRAGRLQAGRCLRLWSESKQASLKDYQEPEILNSDLANLVLELCAWGLNEYEKISWFTPPPRAHFESAKNLLIDLGLVSEQALITSLGKQAVRMGLHPRLATLLLRAEGELEQRMACELCALLSEADLFHSHRGVDIVERMLALQDYKHQKQDALKSWPIKSKLAEQILKSAATFRKTLKLPTSNAIFSLSDLQRLTGKLLLLAYPDRLAKKRTETTGRYLLANGRGASLFEDDPLMGANWLIVHDCNAHKKEGQITSATEIDIETIQQTLGSQITEKNEYRLDEKKQNIIGQQISCYRAITLQIKPLANIPSDAFQQCLKGLLKSEGLNLLNWTLACENWLARASWLGCVDKEFPKLTRETVTESIGEWLLPYLTNLTSLHQLKQVDILALLKGSLSWEQQQMLESEAPEEYVTPSDKKVAIRYDEHQGPTVSVRLQEMFGEIESPKIGGNQVPLRFELLSPAQRPIQTTSDLGNFWRTSYFEVAKEMRGRYPKHRWPEQPLLEKPGHSIKLPKKY